MTVYVDELPKQCKDCTCLNRVNGRCQLLNIYVCLDKKQEDCPLQLLADHDKKVRAEVVEEIRDIAGDYWVECEDYDSITKESKDILIMNNEDLEEILDRVLGGEEWKD